MPPKPSFGQTFPLGPNRVCVWRSTGLHRRRRLAAVWPIVLAVIGLARAETLVQFDFSAGLGPSYQDPRIVFCSPLEAVWSLEEAAGGVAVANDWDADNPANYYCFTMVVPPDYVLDLASVTFDYLSEKQTFWDGPDTGEVRLAVDLQPFHSISGGWQAMDPDGVWHRDVVVDNGGSVVSNLFGRIVVAVAAKGASDTIADLSLDNVRVAGTIRSLSVGTPVPVIVSYSPTNGWRVGNLDSNRYYSLQTGAGLSGEWQIESPAANKKTAQPQLVIPALPAVQERAFMRVVSSRRPLPGVAADGFWQVSSTGALFRAGIIRIHQYPRYARYEDSLTGILEGQAFSFGHCDGYAFGTTDGANMQASYYNQAEDGSVQAGTFAGVRYAGPKYEIWEGDAVLTHAQRFNPGANGYTRIVQASSTTTVALSRTRVLLVATTSVSVDAFQGQNSAYLVAISASGSNISDLNAIYGPADGVCCEVGTGYTGAAYRGYLTFAPPGWTAMTVHVSP